MAIVKPKPKAKVPVKVDPTNKYLTPQQIKAKAQQTKLYNSAMSKIQNNNTESLTATEKTALDNAFGDYANLIASDSSLRSLFVKAIKDGYWSSATGIARFQAEVRSTQWYKDRTSSQQAYDLLASDTTTGGIAELKNKRDQIVSSVRNYVVQNLGLKMDDSSTVAKIESISEDLLRGNFNDWQNVLGDKVRVAFAGIKATEFGGKMATNVTTIQSYYRSMGLPIDPASLDKYASDLVLNNTTLETIQASVRKNASQMWTQFSDRINTGETMDNILYPYKQLIGSMLEVDPETLDFTAEDKTRATIDPLFQKALFSGADGKQVMSLTDLRKLIKQDSRWQYTRNAQEEYAGLTRDLMRMFGAGV